MKIVVVNDYGTLIDEYEVDTSDGTEAVKIYLEEQQPVLVKGDVIQIR